MKGTSAPVELKFIFMLPSWREAVEAVGVDF